MLLIIYIPSRHGNTFTDKVSLNILKSTDPNFKKYSWLDRGSDERQFCSPGVDLPMVTLCRSKFGEYKEYHTSLDNLNFISQKGLQTSYELILRIIQSIELNKKPKNKFLCEPHLSSRNMYPTLSVKNNYKMSQNFDIISFCDGQHDIFDISNKTNLEYQQVSNYIEILIKHKVLKS